MTNGECRGAKPLCRESEGVPQIQSLPPSWPGRGPGGWSKAYFSTLLDPSSERRELVLLAEDAAEYVGDLADRGVGLNALQDGGNGVRGAGRDLPQPAQR